ncbi:hypothetical protein VSDG_03722 [Cytospora chrysosperma]|uniref:Uncharacterized protein n=1 Tax=Cytospora chrysosperma TaxID=252740 RepID=A0A423W681_CYTCH|nr:hypothetical protein VSDG_03722 [Valsa sordida]
MYGHDGYITEDNVVNPSKVPYITASYLVLIHNRMCEDRQDIVCSNNNNNNNNNSNDNDSDDNSDNNNDDDNNNNRADGTNSINLEHDQSYPDTSFDWSQ